MDLKKLLNKEQYEAAINVNGPLLILAGAGSGKTRVLTYRIAHMVKNLGIFPSQILAITFTNKAAGEMKDRVRTLVGDVADNMWVSTFHSSCVRILRREIDKLGYNKNFTIYDTYDAKTLVKQCMKELNINEKDITDSEIIGKISSSKNNMISAEAFKKENEGDFRKNKIADVYTLYQKRLKANNSLDFDDLIFLTVRLLKEHTDVREFYQRKFRYIMVDEYQDTNKSQYELVKLLINEEENICVVGDDDQCIYAWRGADITNILDFEKDFPNAKVVKLEQNYRSKSNILQAANMVIKNNAQRKEKELRTESEAGEKLKVYRGFSDIDEGSFVASEIKRLIKEEGRTLNDFAILYRMNSQSRIFEETFRRGEIPYKIVGGLKFYDRKEIKDIMAYLKLVNNPLDDISLRRIINEPKRNIGDTTVEKVQTFASETGDCMYNTLLDAEFIPGISSRAVASINKFTGLINSFIAKADETPISELIMDILDESGYMNMLKGSKTPEDESRIENLKELVSDAVAFEKESEDKSLAAFLEKVVLVSDLDNLEEEENSVVMMTVHSAKGLEFPVVFLVGMENGIFPGMSSLNSFTEMEESRRLCYVAITRAKEVLYITSAEQRMVFGRTVAYSVSDFVSEIPPSLKELVGGKSRAVNVLKNTGNKPSYNNPHTLKNMQSNYAKEVATSIINSGDKKDTIVVDEVTIGRKVKHSKFGVGTVVSVSGDNADVIVTIAFNSMGIKKLMLSSAPLELL
ncbi:DNA helicase PcrA [Clostridium sp. UBA4548]|uniref:DNA helicase PcrA n=1 Tax=Clostridium sp. UBA4548 TaxID=1946361 RepID=UPI0025C2B78B|nr:DNA helicase PcrA [Clostridium sp. UBA4548]